MPVHVHQAIPTQQTHGTYLPNLRTALDASGASKFNLDLDFFVLSSLISPTGSSVALGQMSAVSTKKRKLSPTLSSASSSTPAPAPAIPLTQGQEPIPSTASSPAPENEYGGLDNANANANGHADQGVGSSRAGSATPMHAPAAATASRRSDRAEMKMPTRVAGSGDGTEHGPQCFAWTDLPREVGKSFPCLLLLRMRVGCWRRQRSLVG